MPESPYPRFEGWQSQDGYGQMLFLPCFFAAVPDDDTKTKILRVGEHFANRHRLNWSKVGQQNQHVSLSAIDKLVRVNAPPAIILQALSKLNVKTFEAVFNRVESYAHKSANYPFVLRANDETIQNFRVLNSEIGRSMIRIGIRAPTSKSFDPHVTLLYSGTLFPANPLPESIRWEVRDIVLIRSHVNFSFHEELHRWPLRDSSITYCVI